MNPVPSVFSASSIRSWDCACEVTPGVWKPARPIGLLGLFLIKRLKAAWLVFSGKADVLVWDKQ